MLRKLVSTPDSCFIRYPRWYAIPNVARCQDADDGLPTRPIALAADEGDLRPAVFEPPALCRADEAVLVLADIHRRLGGRRILWLPRGRVVAVVDQVAEPDGLAGRDEVDGDVGDHVPGGPTGCDHAGGESLPELGPALEPQPSGHLPD